MGHARNALDQLSDSTDALGRVRHTDYDVAGRPVTVTANYMDGVFDPAKPDEDVATVTQYDAAGRVACTVEFANVPPGRHGPDPGQLGHAD